MPTTTGSAAAQAGRHEIDIAELGRGGRPDRTTQCQGQKLGAQAETQDRPAVCDARPQQIEQGRKRGFTRVVDGRMQ